MNTKYQFNLFNVGWQNIVRSTYQNERSVDTIHRLANMLLLSTSAGNMKIKMQLLLLDTLFGWNGVIVDMENPKTIKIHVQHHNMKLYKYLRQIFFTWHNRHVLWNYIVSVIPSSYLSFADTYNHYFSSWPFKTQTQRMLLLIQIDSECCQIYKSELNAVPVCVWCG